MRPYEAPLLESLHQQAHAIATPPQHLEQVAALATKHKDVPAERISLKHGLHLGRETVEPGPHISYTGSQPDARS